MAGKGWSNPGGQASRLVNTDISQVRHRCVTKKLEARAARANNPVNGWAFILFTLLCFAIVPIIVFLTSMQVFLSIMYLCVSVIHFFKILYRGAYILGKMILEALTETPTIMAETVRFVFKRMVRLVYSFIWHWHLQRLFSLNTPMH